MFSRSKGWLPSLVSKPKNPHSLEHLKYLYNVLCKNQTVTEQNRVLLVETLRSISEILIWGDQNDSSVFDFFLEKNMLTFFLRYMRQKFGRYICVQLLQTLNILFENIRNETSLYYLLSNNHINSIIVHKFDFSDEEIMAYYISFLKTLSLKLNKHTIHFFYNEHTNDFALYTEAIKFFNHSEGMVRIAVRTITLNVYKVKDVAMLRYIRDRTAAPYFSNLVWFIGNHILNLNMCVRNDTDHQSRDRLSTLVAEHLDHLHYVNDILLINIDTLNDVLSDQLLNRLLIPLYVYSLTKRKRHDLRQSNRKYVNCVVSLFLLSQVFLIIRHGPLVRQLAEIIFHGEHGSNIVEENTSDSPRMRVREFAAPDETLEETLGSSRGLRPRNESVRVTAEAAGGSQGNGDERFADGSTDSRHLQNSTDEEKIMSTRNQSIRMGGGTSSSQGSFSLENRPYLEALFHSLECKENDYEALFTLCLLYAMGHNDGIHQGLMDSVFMPTARSEAKDNYNVALVEQLIRIITLVTQAGSRVRLCTLELSVRLLLQLVYAPGKSYLQDRHLAGVENARECSAQLLRNFYKSEDIFLDMFEDEYNEMTSRPLNVEYLTMDASILLPPTVTPLTGIDFHKRLPCGEVERARRAIRVFLQVRQLSLSLLQDEETQLPLSKDKDCVKIDNILDLNNSDLIACTVITKEKKQKRFLVIDALQMILVEPDIRRLGWGIVTFVGFLQNVEVNGDKEDSRSLHITVHKPATSQHARPVPLLAARFLFDDHIRCMAAKQRLVKGRIKARQQKMQMIERLLDIPLEAGGSHGHFSRSGPIPGRSHPVRIGQTGSDRRSPANPSSHDVQSNQSVTSGAGAGGGVGAHVPTAASSEQTVTQGAQRRSTIYVEQGTESGPEQRGVEEGQSDMAEEVEVAEEATSEMAFQTLHQSRGDTPSRHDSGSHEASPAPQEIPLEDLSRKNKSKRKEQLTRAKMTQSRLAAELRKQQDHSRSSSQSPQRKDNKEGLDSVFKVGRGRSISLTSDSPVTRSRSGPRERRVHSDSSSVAYTNPHKAKSTHSQELQTTVEMFKRESITKQLALASSSTGKVTSQTPKFLQPAPSPTVSLVLETDECVQESPKLVPPVIDTDKVRTLSDASLTGSESSTHGSNRSLDQLNLGLGVPTGAGAELSQASVTVERLAPPSPGKSKTASDRLTKLAQMVQQYKFEGEELEEESTSFDQ